MKTFLLTTFAFLAFTLTSKAQWTTGPGNINNTNTGNVLIGTTTSSNGLLQINGTGDLLSLTSTSTNPAQFNAWNSSDFRIIQRSNGAMTLWTNTIERMRIDQYGNVGIGTTSPNAKLDVQGLINIGAAMNINTFTPATIHMGGSGNTTNAPYVVLENATPYGGWTPMSEFHITSDGTNVPEIGWTTGIRPGNMLVRSYGYSGGGNINLQAKGIINFLSNDVQRMVINNAGNVGIGTISPDQALTVNGTIHSKSVVVDANIFPDYVFKPTYHLTSLTDVKTYIDQNQHLPNVPSAAEVEKNGLNLGEMNKVLVQKVEELTLYLIDQNRQLADQQRVNKSLQKQINNLARKRKR